MDRPYPISPRTWIMHQRWHDLLFAHWPVPEEVLRHVVPRTLTLDRFDGRCWVGVVPFWMSNVRPRGLFGLPGLSTFLELNVRTYVVQGGKPGVYFFSLDASNPIAVRIARWGFHLPYFDARMTMSGGTWPGGVRGRVLATPNEGWIDYESRRTDPTGRPGALKLRYRPTGDPLPYPHDPLVRWLTARYCLFTSDRSGALHCGEIHHEPWPLQNAEAEIEENTMAAAAGIELPPEAPLLHFSPRLDVQIWGLERCSIT